MRDIITETDLTVLVEDVMKCTDIDEVKKMLTPLVAAYNTFSDVKEFFNNKEYWRKEWDRAKTLGTVDVAHGSWTSLFLEVMEANTPMTPELGHVCFLRDDDCHNYLVPVDKEALFEQLLYPEVDDHNVAFNNTFGGNRCMSPGRYVANILEER